MDSKNIESGNVMKVLYDNEWVISTGNGETVICIIITKMWKIYVPHYPLFIKGSCIKCILA